MNKWVWAAILAAGIGLTVVSVVGLRWMARSIEGLIVRSARNEWRHDDVVRLIRRLILLSPLILLLSLLPWSIAFTTAGVMADQFFRNLVDRWTDGPELFEHLAIDEGEYYGLPLHWRQALAEVAFRDDGEDEALKQFISRIDMRDIEVLEKVANYAVSGGLLELRQATADGNPALENHPTGHHSFGGNRDHRFPVAVEPQDHPC